MDVQPEKGSSKGEEVPVAEPVACLEVRGVSIRFGQTAALDRVDLTVRHGEIHGLVGHNGSGKSTMAKILTGFHRPVEGAVAIDGVSQELPLSSDVHRSGIAAVHQDLCLSGDMTALENLTIALARARRSGAPIRWRAEARTWRTYLRTLAINIRLDTMVRDLAPADRAGLAIARALRGLDEAGRKGLLIVDEATAYFSTVESRRVARILRQVTALGHGVLFIGHNLNEVLEVCDRITILRSGRVVSTVEAKATTADDLVTHMLGRRLDSFYPDLVQRRASGTDRPVLSLVGLSVPRIAPVSFAVAAGEIVGVTGRVGSGYEALPYAIVGAIAHGGQVELDGQPVRLTPAGAPVRGVNLIPADRARHGVWMGGTGLENYAIGRLQSFLRGGWLNHRAIRESAESAMRQYLVHPNDYRLTLAQFSGGNQQKILLASRLVEQRTRVLLLHEPTQGVDAGAKRELLELINRAAAAGTGVLIFSADHEDLVNSCHRIVVVRGNEGVVLDADAATLTEASVLSACMGPVVGPVVQGEHQ